MNTIDENEKTLGKILSYGIEEAPAELELVVMKAIEAENAPRRSYMGFLAGWIPLSISIIGLFFGILTSIILFFPNLSFLLSVFETVQKFVFNPSVMIIILSITALILGDSLLEKRMEKLSFK
jgi:hypothetical protein